ncbi:unnamed protein product, partial [Medioppia subpectinata]
MLVILFFCATISLALANEFRLVNNCPFTVWPGILGNPGKGNPEGGGFQLNSHQTHSYQVGNGWAGRVWPRTNCNGAGHCETGDCGNKIQCNGAGGVPPVSLAEFTLNGAGGQDFYDVSLVDGYNLPIRIRPIAGTYRKSGGGHYDCGDAGCTSDLNARCPAELAVRNGAGATIACMSACMKFNTDEYCCRVLTTVALAAEFQFKNNCPYTVWAKTLGNPGKGNPENGGFTMAGNSQHTFNTNPGWAGRMWGNTGCQPDGHHCKSGDGATPTTLGEWTMSDKDGGMDFYDVSLVDGYNVGMRVEPLAGTFTKQGPGHYDCGTAGCVQDMLDHCPAELAVKDGVNTVACLSACAKFKTDEYCCGGAHSTPETCKSKDWPVNYPAIFKKYCPEAYSYAYDDAASTFTCHGKPYAGYVVTFCPQYSLLYLIMALYQNIITLLIIAVTCNRAQESTVDTTETTLLHENRSHWQRLKGPGPVPGRHGPTQLTTNRHNVNADLVDDMVNVTFRWAETEFPVTVRILKAAQNMTVTDIEAIPGAGPFLKILVEVFRIHQARQAYRRAHNGSDWITTNQSVFVTVNKLNFTGAEIPVYYFNITDVFGNNSTGVKTIAEMAKICHEREVPFVEAVAVFTRDVSDDLFTSMLEVSSNIKMSDLVEKGALKMVEHVGKNFTGALLPRLVHSMNVTGIKFINTTFNKINTVTRLELELANNMTHNITHLVLNGIEALTNESRRFARNSITRVANISNRTYHMFNNQVRDLSDNLQAMSANLSQSPGKLVSIISDRATTLTNSAWYRVANWTEIVTNLTWNYWNDFKNTAEFTTNVTVDTLRGIKDVGVQGVRNMTEVALNDLAPFRFKKFENLLTNTSQTWLNTLTLDIPFYPGTKNLTEWKMPSAALSRKALCRDQITQGTTFCQHFFQHRYLNRQCHSNLVQFYRIKHVYVKRTAHHILEVVDTSDGPFTGATYPPLFGADSIPVGSAGGGALFLITHRYVHNNMGINYCTLLFVCCLSSILIGIDGGKQNATTTAKITTTRANTVSAKLTTKTSRVASSTEAATENTGSTASAAAATGNPTATTSVIATTLDIEAIIADMRPKKKKRRGDLIGSASGHTTITAAATAYPTTTTSASVIVTTLDIEAIIADMRPKKKKRRGDLIGSTSGHTTTTAAVAGNPTTTASIIATTLDIEAIIADMRPKKKKRRKDLFGGASGHTTTTTTAGVTDDKILKAAVDNSGGATTTAPTTGGGSTESSPTSTTTDAPPEYNRVTRRTKNTLAQDKNDMFGPPKLFGPRPGAWKRKKSSTTTTPGATPVGTSAGDSGLTTTTTADTNAETTGADNGSVSVSTPATPDVPDVPNGPNYGTSTAAPGGTTTENPGKQPTDETTTTSAGADDGQTDGTGATAAPADMLNTIGENVVGADDYATSTPTPGGTTTNKLRKASKPTDGTQTTGADDGQTGGTGVTAAPADVLNTIGENVVGADDYATSTPAPGGGTTEVDPAEQPVELDTTGATVAPPDVLNTIGENVVGADDYATSTPTPGGGGAKATTSAGVGDDGYSTSKAAPGGSIRTKKPKHGGRQTTEAPVDEAQTAGAGSDGNTATTTAGADDGQTSSTAAPGGGAPEATTSASVEDN